MAFTVKDRTFNSSIDPLKTVHQLAQTIDDYAAEGEQLRRLAPPLHEALLKAGLFRMLLPKSYNGLEADPLTVLRTIRAVA